MKKLLTLLILNIIPCINAMIFNPADNKSSSGVIVFYREKDGNKYVFLRRLKHKEFSNVAQYGPLFEWYGRDQKNPVLAPGMPTEQDQKTKAILTNLIFKRGGQYNSPHSPHTFTLFTAQADDQYALGGMPLRNYDGDMVCKKLTDFYGHIDRFYTNPDTNELESMPKPFHETFQQAFFAPTTIPSLTED